jgi:DNA-binding transcriptional LysR family regulator
MAPQPPAKSAHNRHYFKEVRFRQIRALVETAKHGNFAEASRQLGISTPSVWRQVRALEEDYGVTLLQAHGRSVRLTEDGARLLELAAPLVEGFDSLRKLFVESQQQAPRTLRILAPAPLFRGLLRKPIDAYRAQFPTVQISLLDCASQEAWELLDAGHADLAAVGAPIGTELPAQLEATPIDFYPFEVIYSKRHPLAKIKKPTLRDLLQQALILPGKKSSSRLQIEYVVSKAGLSDEMNVVMTASHLPLILDYVSEGIGIAIMTRPAVDSYFIPPEQAASLSYRDVSYLLGQDRIVLLNRRGRFDPPHIRALRDLILNHATPPRTPPAAWTQV